MFWARSDRERERGSGSFGSEGTLCPGRGARGRVGGATDSPVCVCVAGEGRWGREEKETKSEGGEGGRRLRDELSRSLARRAGDRTRRTASPPTNAEPDQQRAATSTKPFRQTQPAGTGTRCAMYRVKPSHSGRAWRPFIKQAQRQCTLSLAGLSSLPFPPCVLRSRAPMPRSNESRPGPRHALARLPPPF